MILPIAAMFTLIQSCSDKKTVGASSITVDSIGDGSDRNPGDGLCDDGAGNCTLRAAIEEANALTGTDTIHFHIGSGPNTIKPSSALPFITDPVNIDGYSEPKAREATSVKPARLMIEVDGTNAGDRICGLVLGPGSDGSTIKGLVINRCNNIGIYIFNSNNNIVSGNYLGTDVTGSRDLGNTMFGIKLFQGASNNTIGGKTAADRNLISGNDGEGLNITGSTDNVVQGNYIGTDAAGTVVLANTWGAIALMDGASSNTIGGTTPPERNIIVGGYTVVDPGSTGNILQGNYIGTDVTGRVALTTTIHGGVTIQHFASGNIIGGTTGTTPGGPCTGACNVISGDGSDGIHMQFDVSNNIVQGNYIGTDVTGTVALGNKLHGVRLLTDARNNTIGGTNPGEGNLVSGNGLSGINISDPGSTGNLVQGNFIGTDVSGTLALGNRDKGVDISSPGNTIGGTTARAGNLISGNNGTGIHIMTGDATGNRVQGNYIGTDVAGTAALPNRSGGIYLDDCSHNIIGGSVASKNNIHYNGGAGIHLYEAESNAISYNSIQHNTQRGVFMNNSNNNSLTHNTFRDNGGESFFLDEGSHMNRIADNIFND